MKVETLTMLKQFFDTYIQVSKNSEAPLRRELINFEQAINRQAAKNKLFTKENIRLAIGYWSGLLAISGAYEQQTPELAKTIGYVADERFPLRSLPDIISILQHGHRVKVYYTDQSDELMKAVRQILIDAEDDIVDQFEITETFISNPDAIIIDEGERELSVWTDYLKKFPHLIRKRKTSVAVLNGNEEIEQIEQLSRFIYQFKGNSDFSVKKIFAPKDYDWANFFPHMEQYASLMQDNQYANSYEYNRSVFLLNRIEHWDNGFSLFTVNEELFAPMGVVFYEEYESTAQLDKLLSSHKDDVKRIIHVNEIGRSDPYFSDKCDFPGTQDMKDFLCNL